MQNIKNSEIYSKLRELTTYIRNQVRTFKRCDKYSIGKEMCSILENLLCELAFLNEKSIKEKYNFLKGEFKHGLERFDFKLSLCKEFNSFKSFASWYHAAEILNNIDNQCDNLLKYFKKKIAES